MIQYGFIYLGVVPVRKEPKSSSEQISQLLFGDVAEILDYHVGTNRFSDSWLKIRNLYDNYEGWIDKRNILLSFATKNTQHQYIVSSPIAKIKMDDDVIIVPMSSVLPDKQPFFIDNHRFSLIEGSVIPLDKCNPLLINAVSLLYLNCPYQWGGKSILGIDCSGFTQNVFKFAGIKLPRDASQQANVGQDNCFENIKNGDLCFFDNKDNKITHVGIYLGQNKIIHCSGRVRIDDIDATGIKIKGDNQEYSHRLCKIKTYF
ncbi:MAG: C40 family peptidase [Bacteroidales bacterium]|nr:C40 family peptidase [Bacteroidales bacterium]